jgi:hypothetical protein
VTRIAAPVARIRVDLQRLAPVAVVSTAAAPRCRIHVDAADANTIQLSVMAGALTLTLTDTEAAYLVKALTAYTGDPA